MILGCALAGDIMHDGGITCGGEFMGIFSITDSVVKHKKIISPATGRQASR